MSLSKIIALILMGGIAGGTLAGCGFRPLHGQTAGAAVQTNLRDVYVAQISDRTGQKLRTELEILLSPTGANSNPRYRLNILPKISERKFLKRTDETGTRADLTLRNTFKLFDQKSRKIVTSGTTETVVSFDFVDEEISIITARKAATSSAISLAAKEIHRRIAVFFRNPPPQ